MTNELVPAEALPRGSSMVEVASSRQAQEAQAMVIMAKRYPRDETTAIARIKQACKRKGLAKKATFEYVRGGTPIKGLTIRLAEVLAQCWGNIDFGIIELDQRDGMSDVMSFCCDLETNARSSKVFSVKHERHKKGGQVSHLEDPRDVYEHVANYGARRLRACIEAVIPGDIQDLAVKECKKTLEGKNPEPLIDRIRSMVTAFAEFGVNQEALERRLQYKVDACDVFALEAMRDIYQSLKDGASKREDWFELDTDTTELDKRVADRQAQQPAAGATEPPFNPPTPEEQDAAEDSQADPAVDKTEGVDEPSPEQILERLEARLEVVSTLNAVDELKEQGFALLPADMAEEFAVTCDPRKAQIRAKRGPRSNQPEQEEMFDRSESATERGE